MCLHIELAKILILYTLKILATVPRGCKQIFETPFLFPGTATNYYKAMQAGLIPGFFTLTRRYIATCIYTRFYFIVLVFG